MKWLNNYFSLLVLIFIGLGFLIPSVGLFLKPSIVYLLMVLMLLSSLKIDAAQIAGHLKDLREEIVILAIVFFVTPLLVLLAKPHLDPQLYIGFLIIAAVPCGISVVFLSDIYGGDPSQALTITGLAHLLSPLLVPLVLFVFAGEVVQVDAVDMVWLIVKVVLIPFVLAQIIRRHKPALRVLNGHAGTINSLLLFAIIWAATSPTKQFVVEHFSTALALFAVCLSMIFLLFLLGFLFGKTTPLKITFGICSSYKNYSLALVLALTLFGEVAALPAIAWTIVSNALLAPLHLYLFRA